MEEVTLLADSSRALGSRPARRLRSLGQVPAVLYGHGVETEQGPDEPVAVGQPPRVEEVPEVPEGEEAELEEGAEGAAPAEGEAGATGESAEGEKAESGSEG